MSEPTPDKRLLQHLSQFGIGNYQDITGLLLEIFPGDTNYKDFIKPNPHGSIWSFLVDLRDHKFIKFKSDKLKTPDTIVWAAIQPEGIKLISTTPVPAAQTTYNIGDNAQIGQLSSSSVKSDIRFQKDQINTPRQKKINKVLKIISAILLIIASIIGVIKGISELTKSQNGNEKEAASEKQNIPETPKEVEGARHINVNDILRVKEFSNSKKDSVDIHFLSLSSESTNFANELKAELEKHYKKVNTFPSHSTVMSLDKRFMITRDVLRKTIRIDIPAN